MMDIKNNKLHNTPILTNMQQFYGLISPLYETIDHYNDKSCEKFKNISVVEFSEYERKKTIKNASINETQ